jgi:hypothetical protein
MPQSEKNSGQIYKDAYDALFATQSNEMKARILAAKGDPDNNDRLVTYFIKDVIANAERPAPVSNDKKEKCDAVT